MNYPDDTMARQLRDALAGMVGLIQLVRDRDDVGRELRDAITGNHRYVTAVDTLEAFDRAARTAR